MPLDLPVAIVGTGLIGRAWALAFARAGCEVRLWDPTEGAVEACLAAAGRLIDDLAAQDLLDGQAPEAVRGRMRPRPTSPRRWTVWPGCRRTRPSGSR